MNLMAQTLSNFKLHKGMKKLRYSNMYLLHFCEYFNIYSPLKGANINFFMSLCSCYFGGSIESVHII